MNKVLLVGRISNDPETRITSNNIKYTKFNIAVSRPYSNGEATDFIPATAWRNNAMFIEKYLSKGSLISIEGKFTSNTYENKDGIRITRYEVTVDELKSLESKKMRRDSRQQNTNQNNENEEISFEEDKTKNKIEENDDDIPWDIDL